MIISNYDNHKPKFTLWNSTIVPIINTKWTFQTYWYFIEFLTIDSFGPCYRANCDLDLVGPNHRAKCDHWLSLAPLIGLSVRKWLDMLLGFTGFGPTLGDCIEFWTLPSGLYRRIQPFSWDLPRDLNSTPGVRLDNMDSWTSDSLDYQTLDIGPFGLLNSGLWLLYYTLCLKSEL